MFVMNKDVKLNFFSKHLDLIIVIDKGKAIAMGRHEELLETCSLYQDIYKLEVGNYGSTSA